MLLQQSDLAFFHLLCASYNNPDEQVGNRHKSKDLVNQVDHTICVWSYNKDGPNCQRLMRPEFFFGSTSCFHIARTF